MRTESNKFIHNPNRERSETTLLGNFVVYWVMTRGELEISVVKQGVVGFEGLDVGLERGEVATDLCEEK